jgi:hypothetical protein
MIVPKRRLFKVYNKEGFGFLYRTEYLAIVKTWKGNVKPTTTLYYSVLQAVYSKCYKMELVKM